MLIQALSLTHTFHNLHPHYITVVLNDNLEQSTSFLRFAVRKRINLNAISFHYCLITIKHLHVNVDRNHVKKNNKKTTKVFQYIFFFALNFLKQYPTSPPHQIREALTITTVHYWSPCRSNNTSIIQSTNVYSSIDREKSVKIG